MTKPNQIKSPTDLLRALKELSARIDFGCDACPSATKNDERRCCHNCDSSRGFFKDDEIRAYPKSFYDAKFDPKTGYWRKDIGCILPRSARSYTCLVYWCDSKDRPETTGKLLRAYDKLLNNALIAKSSYRSIE